MQGNRYFRVLSSLWACSLLAIVPLMGCGGGVSSVPTPSNSTGDANGCGSGGAVYGTAFHRQPNGVNVPAPGVIIMFTRDETIERRKVVTDQAGQFTIISTFAISGKVQVLQASPRFAGQHPYDNSVPSDPPLVGTYYVAAEKNVSTVDCGSQTITIQVP